MRAQSVLDLTDKEKVVIFKYVEEVMKEMQHPRTGEFPSPAYTKTVLVNAIAAMYITGKEDSIEGGTIQ